MISSEVTLQVVGRFLPMLVACLLAISCGQSASESGTDESPQAADQTATLPDTEPDPDRPAVASGPVLASPGSLGTQPGRPRITWVSRSGAPPSTSPAATGELVAVGYADFTVRAFGADGGEPVWVHPTEYLPVALHALPPGYVVSGPGRTERLGPGGEIVWVVDAGCAPGTVLRLTTASAYLTSRDGTVVSLDVETGERRWTARPALESDAGPVGRLVALDGVLYGAYSDGSLLALDAATGQQRWVTSVAGPVVVGPTATPLGVFVPTLNGTIFRVALDTGSATEIGSIDAALFMELIPAGNRLVAVGARGAIAIIDQAAGSIAMTKGPGDDRLAGQPALLDDVLLESFASGALAGYDADSGERLWSIVPGSPARSSLAFDGKRVFLSSQVGEVFSLVLDQAIDTVPILDASRVWSVPLGGTFRMGDRFVALRFSVESDSVIEWTVGSEPAGDLVLRILSHEGVELANNLGKVRLEPTVRAAVEAGEPYLLRIERPFPEPRSTIGVESSIVD